MVFAAPNVFVNNIHKQILLAFFPRHPLKKSFYESQFVHMQLITVRLLDRLIVWELTISFSHRNSLCLFLHWHLDDALFFPQFA